MPELPEVEIVKNNLSFELKKGNVIEGIEFFSPKLRTSLKISKEIKFPLTIEGINRRSKYIILSFSKGFILSHLGMTGNWRVERKTQLDQKRKHDHISIHWAHGDNWIYNDPRRFGLFEFGGNISENKWLSNLGPEPLTSDFDFEHFENKIKNSEREIKVLLMDPKVIVGVGNIYACESLFKAQISPFTPGSRLTSKQLKKLLKEAQKILENAIKRGGSTIDSFRSVEGKQGDYQKQHLVYGRESESCPRCRIKIKRKTQAGRSTFWCPKCQK